MPVHEYSRAPGAAGVMMLPIPESGVLREVRGSDAVLEVPGVEGLDITIPIGQTVVPLPEGNRYLGFLFAGLYRIKLFSKRLSKRIGNTKRKNSELRRLHASD